MKIILVSIIVVFILINLSCVYYGKKKIKNVGENGQVSEEDIKKGMRYMIFAAIFSFITIVAISIVAILNLNL